MAAESEAELKQSLKVLSSMKSQEKRRIVEIAASKNIRALTIKE
jgi:hypothetical protein